jgi:predicted  nucleic acid-binding Zn-ribbon protein
MVRHLEHAIITKDVSIETLKNKVANLEKELAAEKDNLATAYSKLKKEKNDLAAKYKTESHGWTQLKKKLEDDVADYQRGFAEQYRDGFENAISQIRIIAPNVDVSKVNMYKVVRNGMIVDEEEDEET